MIGLANDILHVANNAGNDEDRKNIQRALAGIVTDKISWKILRKLRSGAPMLYVITHDSAASMAEA